MAPKQGSLKNPVTVKDPNDKTLRAYHWVKSHRGPGVKKRGNKDTGGNVPRNKISVIPLFHFANRLKPVYWEGKILFQRPQWKRNFGSPIKGRTWGLNPKKRSPGNTPSPPTFARGPTLCAWAQVNCHWGPPEGKTPMKNWRG